MTDKKTKYSELNSSKHTFCWGSAYRTVKRRIRGGLISLWLYKENNKLRD
jgi:hypothetical protein